MFYLFVAHKDTSSGLSEKVKIAEQELLQAFSAFCENFRDHIKEDRVQKTCALLKRKRAQMEFPEEEFTRFSRSRFSSRFSPRNSHLFS